MLTVRELFEFAVDPDITEDTLDAALDKLMEIASRQGSPAQTLRTLIFLSGIAPAKIEIWAAARAFTVISTARIL